MVYRSKTSGLVIERAVALLWLMFAALGCSSHGPAKSNQEQVVERRLRALYDLIQLYRDEHNGALPPSPEDLESWYTGGLDHVWRSVDRNGKEAARFIFFMGSDNSSPFPLIYEGDATLYDTVGVHVLWSDGTVKWDSMLRDLLKYSEYDPRLKLPKSVTPK